MITEVPHDPSSAYGADKEDFIDEDVDFLGPGSVTCGYTYEYEKNEVIKASDYNITPTSRSPAGGGRGLLIVFLTRESAALV